MPKKVFKFGKKTATVSSVPVETYGQSVGSVQPDVVKSRLKAVEMMTSYAGTLAQQIDQYCDATNVYGKQCAQLAQKLLSTVDEPWVDQLEDKYLLRSMMNFGGVLEGIVDRFQNLMKTVKKDVVEPLELLSVYGAKDSQAWGKNLDEQFISYEIVMRDIGLELAGKKRSKGAPVVDADRLDEFEQKIKERVCDVEDSFMKFDQCVQFANQRKDSVIVKSLDTFMSLHRELFDKSNQSLDNLTELHAQLMNKLASDLPAGGDTDIAIFQHAGLLKVKPGDGAARLRYCVLRDDNIHWYEEGRAYNPATHQMNLSLCAARPVDHPIAENNTVPTDVTLSTNKQKYEHVFQLVPHQGTPWDLAASSATDRQRWLDAIAAARQASLQDSPLSDLTQRERDLARKAGRILRSTQGNRFCCDCGAADPQWASINFGCLICVRCSGAHRQLGSHVSKVRSLYLDRWDPETLMAMQELGNAVVNHILEGSDEPMKILDDSGSRLSLRRSGTLSLGHHAPAIPSAVKPFKPTPLGDDATRKQFVQMKYVEKTFMTKVDATPRDLAQRLSEEIGRPSCRLSSCLLLLLQGAAVNQPDPANQLRTPLHVAVLRDNIRAADLLLHFGASVIARDSVGWTSVHYAAFLNHYLILRLIMKRADADDVQLPTTDGQTPISLTGATAAQEAASLLIGDGKDVPQLSVEDVLEGSATLRALSLKNVAQTTSRRSRLLKATSTRETAAAVLVAAKQSRSRKHRPSSGDALRRHKSQGSRPLTPAPPSPIASRSGSRVAKRSSLSKASSGSGSSDKMERKRLKKLKRNQSTPHRTQSADQDTTTGDDDDNNNDNDNAADSPHSEASVESGGAPTHQWLGATVRSSSARSIDMMLNAYNNERDPAAPATDTDTPATATDTPATDTTASTSDAAPAASQAPMSAVDRFHANQSEFDSLTPRSKRQNKLDSLMALSSEISALDASTPRPLKASPSKNMNDNNADDADDTETLMELPPLPNPIDSPTKRLSTDAKNSLQTTSSSSSQADEFEQEEMQQTVEFLRNELLIDVEKVQALLLEMKNNVSTARTLGDAAPLGVRISKTQPLFDQTKAIFTDFVLPEDPATPVRSPPVTPSSDDNDNDDSAAANQLVELKAVVSQGVCNLEAMLARLLDGVLACSADQLYPLAILLRNTKRTLSEQ